MSRGVVGLDRVATLVAGLAALAVGLAAIAWGGGLLDRVFDSGVPASIDLGRGHDVTGASWWGWVAGLGGLVLVVLGLVWLVRHLGRHGVSTLELPGSGPAGELSARASAVTHAAGEAFAAGPGIRSATSRIRTDRHQLVLELDAVTDPRIDLAAAADAAARTAGEVLDLTGVAALHARGRLTVGGRDSRGRGNRP